MMLIYNNTYAIQVVRSQVSESYKYLLSTYITQVDTDLTAARKFVLDVLALDRNFLAMEQANSDDVYYFSKIQMAQDLQQEMNKNLSLESYFLYHAARDDYLGVYNGSRSYVYQENFKQHMTHFLQNHDHKHWLITHKWIVQAFDQQHYLLYLIRSGDLYMGAVIHTQDLQRPLEFIDLGPTGFTVYATSQGEAITSMEQPANETINWRQQVYDYFQTGELDRYVVLTEQSEEGGFYLVAMIPDEMILENLPYLQKINVWILLASFIVIPIGLYYLRRTILLPIQRIINSMKKIQGDNLHIRIEPYPTSFEFQMVNDTFNHMMEQIEDLKIDVYEEQLGKQREELQRLQLQMNPHFYLNSLNMLYSLARVNKNELVQELSLCLIQHFRFMVRSNLSFVQLKDELEHTRNYLRIQELRYPGSLTHHIDAPEFLLENRIPPLFIQTFIENSIKHAVRMDEPIHIEVRIDLIEQASTPYMQVCISDSGQGFPEDVLTVLNAGESLADEQGKHIGIWNVQRRMKLLYKEHASISFHNNKPTGASVRLVLPLQPME